jgi:hypothetical protein
LLTNSNSSLKGLPLRLDASIDDDSDSETLAVD